jgi:hypothetical protein
MSSRQLASVARVSAFADPSDVERPVRSTPRPPAGCESDRRAHTRLTSAELVARLKYGEAITLIDISVGGALIETAQVLRPDTKLVFDLVDSRTLGVTPVVSRVLRSHVAGIEGGIRYRGACQFHRPLSHPTLVGPPEQPLLPTDARDFLKLEFALKTIVEGYFRRPASSNATGNWRDTSALLDALVRLRAAAERRGDPIQMQMAPLLSSLIPALQQRKSPDAIIRDLETLLARELPLLAIGPAEKQCPSMADREMITLSMAGESDHRRVSVSAEFPPGFALDETQFRLLKAGAYLIGLVGRWRVPVDDRGQSGGLSIALPGQRVPAPTSPAPTSAARRPLPSAAVIPSTVPPDASAPETTEAIVDHQGDLPAGWQRAVVRYSDGQVVRGYVNDFHPERLHLHVSPRIQAPASERLLVPLSRLKALFFVKSLRGDRERVDDQTFDTVGGARKVEVTFRDGEVMRGSTLSYKPNGRGFFLQPANSASNNIRVFVLMAGVRHMRFL